MYQTPSIEKMVECMLLRCWSSGKLKSLVLFRPILAFPLGSWATNVYPALGPSTTFKSTHLTLLRSIKNWFEPISMIWSWIKSDLHDWVVFFLKSWWKCLNYFRNLWYSMFLNHTKFEHETEIHSHPPHVSRFWSFCQSCLLAISKSSNWK